jgi:hypothetical protein
MTDPTDPIRHTVTAPCAPDHAFITFTSGMGGWWDPALTPDPDGFAGITVPSEVDGDVVMELTDKEPYPFGRVTAWEPGERYEQTWWLSMSRSHPSTLTVGFRAVEDDDTCEVHLEHGGWHPDNAVSRARFDEWPRLLERFARACR